MGFQKGIHRNIPTPLNLKSHSCISHKNQKCSDRFNNFFDPKTSVNSFEAFGKSGREQMPLIAFANDNSNVLNLTTTDKNALKMRN